MMRSLQVMLAAAAISLGLAGAASAKPIEWMGFTAWDHNSITTTGQTFTDICGDLDVTVTGLAGSGAYTSISRGIQVHSGADADSVYFTFAFSQPTDLVVEVQSLDLSETLNISSDSTAIYTHVLGAVPNQSGNLTLSGNGNGFGATGSARGIIEVGNASTLTWAYSSTGRKFERFRIGKQIVPEPSALTLLGLGSIAILRRRRV